MMNEKSKIQNKIRPKTDQTKLSLTRENLLSRIVG